MSDTIITLNNKTNPMNIKYVKSPHGFSDSHFNSTKYLFELIIKGEPIDTLTDKQSLSGTTFNLADKQSFSGTLKDHTTFNLAEKQSFSGTTFNLADKQSFSGTTFNLADKQSFSGTLKDHTTFNLADKQSFSGTKYFRSLEDNKYSHLIKLNHMIKLKDIKSYTATLTIIPSDLQHNFELEGIINKNESSSTQRSMNMYIEFTQNDMGNAMCSCFYTGLDHNKIFASPPI